MGASPIMVAKLRKIMPVKYTKRGTASIVSKQPDALKEQKEVYAEIMREVGQKVLMKIPTSVSINIRENGVEMHFKECRVEAHIDENSKITIYGSGEEVVIKLSDPDCIEKTYTNMIDTIKNTCDDMIETYTDIKESIEG